MLPPTSHLPSQGPATTLLWMYCFVYGWKIYCYTFTLTYRGCRDRSRPSPRRPSPPSPIGGPTRFHRRPIPAPSHSPSKRPLRDRGG